MEDEVEYLGTKFAPQEPLDDPCEAQASVTGITLHVEKCGEKPAHELTFYRARSGYVNIGRKSGSDDKSMRRENDDHNLVFACQVVSAKHAKLVLSDSGQVYVVDLHSRHGTHLLRRGETTPRMLKAEVETALADGDVLTFGKVVGAGSYHVSPVTVRVELLKGRSTSEIPSSSDRALTPISSLSHIFSRTRKLNSGRYGLFVPPCVESESAHSSSSLGVSSDASSSASEHESDDVEDEPSRVPSVVRDSQPSSPRKTIRLSSFPSFFREMYNNAGARSPIIVDELDEPVEVAPGSPASAVAVRQPSPVLVVIESASKSRSHSPMELATPSPSPPSEAQQSEPAVVGAWPSSRPESPRHSSLEVEVAHSETAAESSEPAAPTAPASLQPSPSPQPPRSPQPSTSQNRFPLVPEHNSIDMNLPPPLPIFPPGGPFSSSIAPDFGLPRLIPPPPPCARVLPFHPPFKVMIERANAELSASIKTVEDRITSLQDAVDDLKSRQSVTEDDVIDLQSHVDMLEPESQRLLCRMNGAERNIASLSSLHGMVNNLRDRLDAPEQQQAKLTEAPLADVRACAEALNNLVSEMKLLREDVEKRIEEKMEAMNAARTQALDALKEVTSEAESIKSAKRKREEDDEGDSEQVEEQEKEPQEVPVVLPEVPMEEDVCTLIPILEEVPPPSSIPISVPGPSIPIPVSVPAPSTPTPVSVPLPVPVVVAAPEVKVEVEREAGSPPPRKRARTAMVAVAHTAAAMAIGAAATWSALAFA